MTTELKPIAAAGKMSTKTAIRVGRQEVDVSGELYAAYNREARRVHRKNQRLRKDGLYYATSSLDELYAEDETEAVADVNVEETAVKRVWVEQLWQAVRDSLDEIDAGIIIGYYRDRLTETEMAENIGISQQAVSKRRKKSEQKLKTVLGDF